MVFDGFLDDLKRMNKRQVRAMLVFYYLSNIILSLFFMILVSLSSVKFWYDRFIGLNDMERFNGVYRQ